MSDCYRIRFSDRFGAHEGAKWAETSAEALRLLKKSHAVKGGRGPVLYGATWRVDVEGEQRARGGRLQAMFAREQALGVVRAAPQVEIHEAEREDLDSPLLTLEHDAGDA